MTRARESEEVSEVEEEKATNIVSDWDSPDLAVDLVDQIWDMVKGRVAELGSLSSGAKMAMKIFVKRVFTIFASNASFLRVIANLQN